MIKKILFPLIILFSAFLIYITTSGSLQIAEDFTLSPWYTALELPARSIDIITSRVLPADTEDEVKLGEKLKGFYGPVGTKPRNVYLNRLIKDLSLYSSQRYSYRVYTTRDSRPNAFALPGGVIFVTNGLLETLETEAELVSILAHEMGHIERGHCFSSVKFQLSLEKADLKSLGELTDMMSNFFMRHSFSKTQESEADLYAFELLLRSKYTPSALADAFTIMEKSVSVPYEGDVIRDYFSSHPPLSLRKEKYRIESEQWWKNNKEKRYNGKRNLKDLRAYSLQAWNEEWTTGP